MMSGNRSEASSADFIKGMMKLDSDGSPISGVRLDVSKVYDNVPELLQKYIDNKENTAWSEIRNKIDYLYFNMNHVLAGLDIETNYIHKIRDELSKGKKILFKPNLLAPFAIDEVTHCEGAGCIYCTQWPFVAAVLRWFHDKQGIRYSQMAIGEASPYIINLSQQYSKAAGETITTEAVIEGRSGDFYGGWGFYFVRKYLSDCHHGYNKDDPMKGYEESRAGRFIPPGKVVDQMMVYDLNKVLEDTNRGRTVKVPEGINYDQITIHKVVIGGNPQNPSDRKDYPGCVLVNLPKLKIHAQDLITNATKNLGIGLYPMLSTTDDDCEDFSWKYAFPFTMNASLKAKLPHSPWVIEMDENTCLPKKNERGELLIRKTAGFSGTQCDILRAVQVQEVMMLHITDAITVLNISHDPGAEAEVIREGYVWSSLDCIALDNFCARYCFNTIPMRYGQQLKREYNWNTEFVRQVPIPYINGNNISTTIGLDTPLFRYDLYRYAQERGVGQLKYYVIGWDTITNTPIASLEGHIGRIEDDKFCELMTQTMYYNPLTILHDLQATMFNYAKACDALTGSTLFNEILESFDENYDGVIDYDEKGMGFETAQLNVMSFTNDMKINLAFGSLIGAFFNTAYFAKYGDSNSNPYGYDYMKGKILIIGLTMAYNLSKANESSPDLFIPDMYYGLGNWPSWQTIIYLRMTSTIYGAQSVKDISLGSLYGLAFQYADKIQNKGGYTGSVDQNTSDPSSINSYIQSVLLGENTLINFILYVPREYGSIEGIRIPNVVETDDPSLVFTVQFNETW